MKKDLFLVGIIPARYGSTRFEGKPLVKIGQKTMIERTYRQAEKCEKLAAVWVATDDERIFEHVKSFGGNVVMTQATHPTGTDRIGEAVEKLKKKYPNLDGIINIQGDEPFILPQQIEKIADILGGGHFRIATLAKRLSDWQDVKNQNIVKVVFGKNGQAIYFSRHAIPFVRGVEMGEKWLENQLFFKHIGLYGYRISALKQIIKLKSSSLEMAESLEQLRWLEAGLKIGIQETEYETIGIDVPEDLEKIDLQNIDNQ